MDTLEYIIDYSSIASKVASRKDELFKQIKSDVTSVILRMSPSQTLSFRIINQSGRYEYVPMAVERKYAKVLWCFLRNKNYEEGGVIYKIESDVTTPILNQVEKTIVDFYSSPETRDCITAAVSEAVNTSNIVQASVEGGATEVRKAIQNEVASRIANHSLSDVKSSIVSQVTDQVVSFMNTSMMQQIVNTVGTCVTAGAGKIVVSKIAIVLSKSISVTTLKSVVMSIVKKIGLTTIAKTAVGKAVALALTTIGLSANAAFFLALIPIIAVILVHEYNSFPRKLANKVPDQVVSDLKLHFDEMNTQIVNDIMSELSRQISSQQSTTKKSIKKGVVVTLVCILLSLLIWAFCIIDCTNHNDKQNIPVCSESIVLEIQSEETDEVESIDDEREDDGLLDDYAPEYQQDFYVGKKYSGGGNGGGLGTSLTIHFESNGECICVSDWYQAFENPVSIKGFYFIKEKNLFVKCHIAKSTEIEEGYDVDFKFDISDSGETLSFDHSDPNEEGTIGNNFMTLTEE